MSEFRSVRQHTVVATRSAKRDRVGVPVKSHRLRNRSIRRGQHRQSTDATCSLFATFDICRAREQSLRVPPSQRYLSKQLSEPTHPQIQRSVRDSQIHIVVRSSVDTSLNSRIVPQHEVLATKLWYGFLIKLAEVLYDLVVWHS